MATTKLTEENFNDIIENNDIVLVDCWAEWCAPCRAFGPIYEKVSDNHPEIKFTKVNTEEEQGIAAAFQIRSIPTLMIFREKILLFSQAGMLPENVLEELITKVSELDMDEIRAKIAEEEKKHQESASAAPN